MKPDKVGHAVACGLLTVLGAHYMSFQTAALSAFLIVTIWKELVWDLWWKKGTFDAYDILANFVGSGIGAIAAFFMGVGK
jgi:hypothetical protein